MPYPVKGMFHSNSKAATLTRLTLKLVNQIQTYKRLPESLAKEWQKISISINLHQLRLLNHNVSS